MELYEQTAYKGYHINIYYDPDPESPRKWDNLGTFYTAHRRYQPEEDFDKHFNIEDVCENGRPGTFRDSFLQKYIAQNIYMLDHSGQTVSTTSFNDPWDSGWLGIVAVSIEKVKKEYGWSILTAKRREQIEKYLTGEVETYDDYLTGKVYGYRITLENDDKNTLDSCWGYFGDESLKHLEEECKSIIDGYISQAKQNKLKGLAEKFRKYGRQLWLPFPDLQTTY
ncbi:MAG: hypothetical protein LUD40_12450 [Phocaeicola dorei]|nr:hypothetical protein [Phocaeicola dorei]